MSPLWDGLNPDLQVPLSLDVERLDALLARRERFHLDLAAGPLVGADDVDSDAPARSATLNALPSFKGA